MADFPALPLWTDAYLADTRTLSTLEHGAYLLLLMEAWRRPDCNLPNDDVILARLAGLSREEWDHAKVHVMEFWIVDEKRGVIRQKRLTKERKFLDEKRAKNRASAVSAWNKKKKADANAMRTLCQNDATRARSTPTPTPTPTNKKDPPSGDPKKGCRLPESFMPDLAEAVRLGLSENGAKHEAEQFRDYWRGVSGEKGVKKDWPATWRMWVRNCLKRSGGARGSPPPKQESDYWRRQRELTEEAERRAGYGQRTDERDFDRQPAFDLGQADYETR